MKNDSLNFFSTLNESADDMVLNETLKVLQEKNVVKLDKQTLKKRLLTQSTLLAAKDAKDPLYLKYAKVAKLKRLYRRKIQEKYFSKGKQKMKEFLKAHKALEKSSK